MYGSHINFATTHVETARVKGTKLTIKNSGNK